ncbi:MULTISPECIES: toll/interleukin-1 receptor domain-containing protein [Pseudofrankia]|uniref:toll/interleukin-1 receptor domain-containing protein n=1 Tax=Pseudofrankia TaxID=2994363 RepID=UPI000234B2C0|nr:MULTISPECIES: TIR domain-containing protein [Pseudofrankia]
MTTGSVTGGSAAPGGVRWDLAVSFAEPDRGWADWLVWQLQDAGRRATAEPLPAGRPGTPAVAAALRTAAGHADQVMVVLSAAYLAALGDDEAPDAPTGGQGQEADPGEAPAVGLIVARVEDLPRPALLRRAVSFDLFGLEPPVAREWLRRQLAALPTATARAGDPAPAPSSAAPPVPPAPGAPTSGAAAPSEARPAEPAAPEATETAPRMLAEVPGPHSPMRAVVFPSTGGMLVNGAQDGRVRLFDLANPNRPTLLTVIEYGSRLSQEWVRALAVSADGTRVAVAGDGRRVALWDITDPSAPEEVFSEHGHRHYIRAVALSPDAHLIASGGQDKVVALWDTRRSGPDSLLVTLTDHRKGLRTVAFSVDGRRLATGGDDDVVLLWDLADPAKPTRMATLAAHRDSVHAALFVPSGTLLATAGGDRVARLWDVASPAHPEPVADLSGHRKAVTALAVTADGRGLATGGADGAVLLWDLTDPAHPARVAAFAAGHGGINDLAFSRDGALLAAACAGKATILWSTGSLLAAARH